MPLEIIAHRGVRLNEGVGNIRYAGKQYAANTTLSYPGLKMDKSAIDFEAHAYENTLRAICTAWQLGYKAEVDVYSYGIIHHDRFIKRDQLQLIDDMTPEAIAAVNLSTSGKPLDDGNRIPTLTELLDAQAGLKAEGLQPPPRLQLELKKPTDVPKVVGDVMARIESGALFASDIRITSFNYEMLAVARAAIEQSACSVKPELGYLISHEALDYVYLDKSAPDYKDQLKAQAAETIPLFFRERLALPEELKAHFPELYGLSMERMQEAVPSLVERYGVAEFEKRYESYMALFIGSGLDAAYRLKADALASAPFDIVHIPMDAAPGVAEAYKQKLDETIFRGGKLQANAHSVSSKGQKPSQLLRAFLLLDKNAELTLDFPEMVPAVFAELLAGGTSSSREDAKMQIAFDPTRKKRIDGVEFSVSDVEKATKRFFDIIGIPYSAVEGGAQSRIGGGSRHARRIEVDPYAQGS